jgi:hypothetical protein
MQIMSGLRYLNKPYSFLNNNDDNNNNVNNNISNNINNNKAINNNMRKMTIIHFDLKPGLFFFSLFLIVIFCIFFFNASLFYNYINI